MLLTTGERRVVTPLLEVGCRQSASLSYFERYGTELSSSTDIRKHFLARLFSSVDDNNCSQSKPRWRKHTMQALTSLEYIKSFIRSFHARTGG